MSKTRLTALSALAWLAPTSALAEAPEPLSDLMPYIVDAGDDLDLSPMERMYGVDPAAMDIEPFWQGTMLFTKDSQARDILGEAEVPPLPAENYEASAGILYLEMGGVTLSPNCMNGDTANAALNCSPLVDSEVSFPAFGTEQQRAAMFETLAGYYEPFNIVMSTSRPPDWVPYTMAVIGGSAGLAGQPGGVCGVANVACDGLKRNHVSLTFPQSCGGVSEIAAQETSHNWGLEHVNIQADLMYPFATGGFKTFHDQCMTISHATGEGVTQCGYIHELYCGEEEQNSFQELLGVFGPREEDNEPPSILTIEPEDGTAFTTGDNFLISGTVAENSNFIAVKWTLEGGEEPFTRCTNKTCDQDFNLGVGFDPNDTPFDFVSLAAPPEGEYTATMEVMDAYGGYDMRTITIYVNDEGEPPTTDSESDSETDTGPDTESGTTSATATASGTDTTPDDDENADDDNDDDDGDTDSAGIIEPGEKGCGCTAPGRGAPFVLLFAGLGLAFVPRRRR